MRHPSVILALSYSFGEYSESSKEDPCMCITKLEVIQEIKSLDVPNDRFTSTATLQSMFREWNKMNFTELTLADVVCGQLTMLTCQYFENPER